MGSLSQDDPESRRVPPPSALRKEPKNKSTFIQGATLSTPHHPTRSRLRTSRGVGGAEVEGGVEEVGSEEDGGFSLAINTMWLL